LAYLLDPASLNGGVVARFRVNGKMEQQVKPVLTNVFLEGTVPPPR
jgi:hypothetical protein